MIDVWLGGGSIGESSETCSMEGGGAADTSTDSALRTSKSDTSLSDSFVVVSAPASPAPVQKAKMIQPTVDTG